MDIVQLGAPGEHVSGRAVIGSLIDLWGTSATDRVDDDLERLGVEHHQPADPVDFAGGVGSAIGGVALFATPLDLAPAVSVTAGPYLRGDGDGP